MIRWLRGLFWITRNPYLYQVWEWRHPWQCPVCDLVSPSLWAAMRHVVRSEEREQLAMRQ